MTKKKTTLQQAAANNPAARAGREVSTECPPFTRFDLGARATIDEFEKEQMGIAAKE